MVKAASYRSSPESIGEEDTHITLADMHNLLQNDRDRKQQICSIRQRLQNTSARSPNELLSGELDDGPLRIADPTISEFKYDKKPEVPARFCKANQRLFYKDMSEDVFANNNFLIYRFRLSTMLSREQALVYRNREDRKLPEEYSQSSNTVIGELQSKSSLNLPISTAFSVSNSGACFQQNLPLRSSDNFDTRPHSPTRSPRSHYQSNMRVNAAHCSHKAAHIEENDIEYMSQEIDCDRIEMITGNIDNCCYKISKCHKYFLGDLLDSTQKDFTLLGFCLSQLWLSEPDGGLSFHKKDKTFIKLPKRNKIKLFDDIFMTKNKNGDHYSRNKSEKNNSKFLSPGGTGIVRPGDPSWDELIVLIQSTSPENRLNSSWRAVHIIPFSLDFFENFSDSDSGSGSGSDNYSDSVDRSSANVAKGFIIAVEMTSSLLQSVPKEVSNSKYSNSSRNSTIFSIQLYRQLATAIGLRLSILDNYKTHNQKKKEKKLVQTLFHMINDKDIIKSPNISNFHNEFFGIQKVNDFLQSKEFLKCFQIEKSVILMTNEFLSPINDTKQQNFLEEMHNKINLFQYSNIIDSENSNIDKEKFQKINLNPIDQNSFWMEKLLKGKSVLVNFHEDQKNQKFTKTNKTRIDEECNFNINENKIENEYEKENESEIGTFRRLHNQYDEELSFLVKNILPTARNVLLKLIKTFEGFCIILFFNQILIEENVQNLNSNSCMVYETGQYVHSNVFEHVRILLNMLQSKYTASLKLKENVRFKSQIDEFYDQIRKEKEENLSRKTLLNWQNYILQNKIEDNKEKIILMPEKKSYFQIEKRKSIDKNQKDKNQFDRLNVRTACTFELAIFCSKIIKISTLDELGDLIINYVPKIFNIQKVVFFKLRKEEGHEYFEKEVKDSIFYLPIFSSKNLKGRKKHFQF